MTPKFLVLLSLLVPLIAKAEVEYPPALGAMSNFVFFKDRTEIPNHKPMLTKNGKKYTLQDFKGKVILANFWAHWCAPCKRELPSLAKLQKKYNSNKMQIILLDVNASGAKPGQNFISKNKQLKNLINLYEGGGEFSKQMQLRALPITFLIDQNSKIVGYLPGEANWNAREANFIIDFILNQKS